MEGEVEGGGQVREGWKGGHVGLGFWGDFELFGFLLVGG